VPRHLRILAALLLTMRFGQPRILPRMTSAGHTDGPARTARQMVGDWLADRIESGQLQPGDRIPSEPQLSEMIGVSRSSVREAVQHMVAAQMLEIRHGVGTFVLATTPEPLLRTTDLLSRLTPESVLDLIEIRQVFEAGIVRIAVHRATPEDLQALERAVRKDARAAQGDGSPEESDEQFHLALAEATHNRAMVQMMLLLNNLFRYSRARHNHLPGAAERAHRAHLAVLTAIQARDARRAHEAIITNLEDLRRQIVAEARSVVELAARRGPTPPLDDDAV
jgi:GntR family transcriptional regulator, transcriptional repressor for pyruvate dehydrogenase complex